MSAPQVVMAALLVAALFLGMERHGKPKTGIHSVWLDLIAAGLQVGLLYWGGFWS